MLFNQLKEYLTYHEVAMILLEIETRDIRILFDLLNNPKSFSTGDSVEIPGNAKLIFKGMIERRPLDFPAIIEIAVEYGDQILTGVVAAWIYDKLKNRPLRLRFDKKEIEFSEKAIEAMLKQHRKKGN